MRNHLVGLKIQKKHIKSLEVFGFTLKSASKSITEMLRLHLNPKASTNVNWNDTRNKPGDIEDWIVGLE